MKTITAMALGGAVVYFLDPVSGSQRRARASRRVQSLMKLGQRAAAETGRPEVANAIGRMQRVAGGADESPVILDSRTAKTS